MKILYLVVFMIFFQSLYNQANAKKNEIKLFDLKKDIIIEKMRTLFFHNKFSPLTIQEENEISKTKNLNELFEKLTIIIKEAIDSSNQRYEELANIFIPFIMFIDEILISQDYSQIKKVIHKKFSSDLPFTPKKKEETVHFNRNVATDKTLAKCDLTRNFAIECFRTYFDLNHDDIVQRGEIEYAKSKFPPTFLKLGAGILSMLSYFGIANEPVDIVMKKCDLDHDGQITMKEFFNNKTECLDSCKSLHDLDKYFCSRAKKAAEKERHKQDKKEIDEIIKQV